MRMKARWLARLLRTRLLAMSQKRTPDFQVIRGEDEAIYLRRWWILPRNNFCNIYLHNMILDDDHIMHDHMYVSLSLILTDGLDEILCDNPKRDRQSRNDGSFFYPKRRRTLLEGDLVWRSSRMSHQLIVKKEAWTLFMTGPRIKEWGFWCPRGFRHWKEYVAISQDPSGQHKTKSGIGQGCGEME